MDCANSDCSTSNLPVLPTVRRCGYCDECFQIKRVLCASTRTCMLCEGSLVRCGARRVNGREHCDWSTRYLHKKCWKRLGVLG